MQIGSEFFMKEITDTKKLNGIVEIHDQELDEDEVQSFIAKRFET